MRTSPSRPIANLRTNTNRRGSSGDKPGTGSGQRGRTFGKRRGRRKGRK